MKVVISFETTKEEDGYESFSSVERTDVEDLYVMGQMLTDALRGAGFSYVVNVGFETDKGDVIFGTI